MTRPSVSKAKDQTDNHNALHAAYYKEKQVWHKKIFTQEEEFR